MTEASINPALVSSSIYTPLTIYPLTNSSEARTPVLHRLCEVSWRLTDEAKAKGKQKRSPVCIAVPFIKLTVEPEAFAAELTELFETAQDNAIGRWINEQIEAQTNWNMIGKPIPVELTTPAGLAAAFAESRSKLRLSKDAIISYFDNHLLESVVAKLLEKNPAFTNDAMEKAADRFRNAVASLASPRTMLDVPTAITLAKLVETGSDSKLRRAMLEKLDGFINPKAAPTLEELF